MKTNIKKATTKKEGGALKKIMMTATRTTSKGAALPQWVQVSFMLKCVMLATSAVMVTSASGKGPTCTSHVGVPDFAIAGKAPQKQRGLTFCQEHKASTCCDKDTTDSVRRVVYNMQSNQFSARCRDAWTALECSVCDPRAGVLPKTPVCASTCDSLYRACADEYFAEDSMQRLTPCRASDTICTKLSDWVTGGGAEMCAAAGYQVVSAAAAAAAGGWCFDGATDRAATGDPSKSGGGGSSSSPSSSSSSSSSNKKSGSKGDSSGKDKKKGKKSGGSKQDADEFKKAEAWMKRMYIFAFVGLLAHFGVKMLGRYLKNSSSGAARNAARLAAENRARRSTSDTHYL